MLYRAFIECLKANFYLCPWPGVLNNVNEGHTCINRYICNGMGEIIMVQTRIWTLALCVIISPIPFTFDARPTPETSLEKTWNIYYKDQRSFGEGGGVLEKVRSVRSPESNNSVGNLTEHLIRSSGGPGFNSVWPIPIPLHTCIDEIGDFLSTMLVFLTSHRILVGFSKLCV